jgi:glycosyltransferase involved in cell wall biosynthesis
MNTKKYTICVDARLLLKSGIGRYLSELIPSISIVYNLICIVSDEGVEFMEHHQIQYLICNEKIYSIREQFVLPRIVPFCDLFWSPHFNIPLLPIKARNRLVTIHDAYHLAFGKNLSFMERIYANIFFRMALRLSKAVITVSNFSKNELIKYTGSVYLEKINVILNGVSTFSNESLIPPDDYSFFYLLYVGNVKPHKNLKNAVLAFKEFCLTYPNEDFKFIIVGQKEGFVNSDRSVENLLFDDDYLRSKIVFTGYVSDDKLKMIYKNAYCLIFPSLYEGFGLPPLEAMQLGTPAIVSNCASMPELCGDAVVYFDPKEIGSITKAIETIVKNKELYLELKLAGVEQVKRFKWSTSIQEHLGLIKRLI